jgi:hypothetical protein
MKHCPRTCGVAWSWARRLTHTRRLLVEVYSARMLMIRSLVVLTVLTVLITLTVPLLVLQVMLIQPCCPYFRYAVSLFR